LKIAWRDQDVSISDPMDRLYNALRFAG